ncbi:ABC transporter permease [Candidatus Chloroploca sp. M-50]|uniref:ABC transporter permease n=1 Tax=Candidatus Chloroploca mongolica TaxID=2528176 RepID=A0ABS4D9K5_9CHLR|nr:ABC transporter permease [Candidatus Chloroploca mongolica]MBP1466113.1 ABC transporter permease [Candidatus Chloroploca mongolica]
MPLLAVVVALCLGALVLLGLGKDPILAYGAMFGGAFGTVSGLTQTLAKATPLILVGLGVTIAFRARVINIGAEGQIIVGALGATAFALSFAEWPGWFLLPLTALMGALAGGLWGLVPGILKARLAVNEILSTVMMNAIAFQLMNFLLRGPMLDPAQVAAGTNIPQSAALPAQVWIERVVPRTLFHWGFFLALALAIAVTILLWRTTLGYRIRAVGFNPAAARYAGIPVATVITLAMVLGGSFAGLAGAIEVMGVHRRIVEGISGGYGFNGIVVALFGRLHPLGVIPSAFLFGGLLVGADQMQRTVQVPAALITALNGLVVLMVVSSTYWSQQRIARRQSEAARPSETHAKDEQPLDARLTPDL